MRLVCRALLFDLDGVLVDSTASVERQWERWAAETGVGMEEIRPVWHGRPSVEVIRMVAPHLDANEQSDVVDGRQSQDAEGVVALPGARELLRSLPEGSWTVVTSGRRVLAEARLGFAGLPVPPTIVVADEIERGKPHPEPYLTGAQRLGAAPADCIVVEDAPAGIEAARAAGMRAIALTTTHEAHELEGADAIAPDLEAVEVSIGAELEVRV